MFRSAGTYLQTQFLCEIAQLLTCVKPFTYKINAAFGVANHRQAIYKTFLDCFNPKVR